MSTPLLICVFLAASPAVAGDLEITGSVLPISATAPKASGFIRLTNKGAKPIPITLRGGNWDNSLAGSIPGPVTMSFSETQGGKGVSEYQGVTLAPGASRQLWVEITGINAPGITGIPLLNAGEKAGSIEVLRIDLPFSVKMDPATPEILLAHGQDGELRFVNEDTSSYRISWRLELPNQKTYSGRDEIVPSKGLKAVKIDTSKNSPFSKWSWVAGLLKDDIQDGILTLTFQPKQGEGPPPGVPSSVVHARTRLRYFPTFGGIFSNAVLIIVMLMGALTSLFLKLWLPNTRRKLKLKEDLELLGRQIADVSGRVGVRPSVILRVQQKRLLGLLDPKQPGSRWTLSPDFEDIAKQCEASTARLAKQMELIRSLDHCAARLACLMPKPLPPTLLEQIDNGIDRIVSLAVPLEANEQDLQALQADVDRIAGFVQQMEQSNTVFREVVQKRLHDVAAFFQPLLQVQAAAAVAQGAPAVALAAPLPLALAAQRVRQDLPATFQALFRGEIPEEIPEDVSFETLSQIDADVFKLHQIRRYVQLSPDLNQPDPPPNSIAGLYPQALKYLRLRSWDAMKTVQSLIGQAEQALYREDIEYAIRERRVDIWPDRLEIRPNTPVEFALRFGREALNQASVREEYRCAWEFQYPALKRGFWKRLHDWFRGAAQELPPPVRPPQRCWSISQYFPAPGNYTVRVTFENWLGEPLADAQGATRDFTVKPRVLDKTGPRLRLELVTMALALAPALFALLTAAQDQVSKASWYAALGAVFALGFGIDILKNLLTQKPPESNAAAPVARRPAT